MEKAIARVDQIRYLEERLKDGDLVYRQSAAKSAFGARISWSFWLY